MKVYKVVREKTGGTLVSAFAGIKNSDKHLEIEYEINEKTKGHALNPVLFAFDDLKKAKSWARCVEKNWGNISLYVYEAIGTKSKRKLIPFSCSGQAIIDAIRKQYSDIMPPRTVCCSSIILIRKIEA